MHYLLIDAAYADRVCFDLTVHFERTLGRRVPKADLARWLECVALDGGVRAPQDEAAADNAVCAVFLHNKEAEGLQNFAPSHFANEIDGKAFRSTLGEFTMQCASSAGFASAADFYGQSLEAIGQMKDVESITLVPDAETYADAVRTAVGKLAVREATVLALQPLMGCPCRFEQLGYSFRAALGISSDELARQ